MGYERSWKEFALYCIVVFFFVVSENKYFYFYSLEINCVKITFRFETITIISEMIASSETRPNANTNYNFIK